MNEHITRSRLELAFSKNGNERWFDAAAQWWTSSQASMCSVFLFQTSLRCLFRRPLPSANFCQIVHGSIILPQTCLIQQRTNRIGDVNSPGPGCQLFHPSGGGSASTRPLMGGAGWEGMLGKWEDLLSLVQIAAAERTRGMLSPKVL